VLIRPIAMVLLPRIQKLPSTLRLSTTTWWVYASTTPPPESTSCAAVTKSQKNLWSNPPYNVK